MKTCLKRIDLTDSVVSVYDQTKTTVSGRAVLKSLLGQNVVAPPLTKFIDVATDTTGFGLQTPGGTMHLTANGRLFVAGTIAAGILPLMLYTFDLNTGATAYVGKINLNLPNTAATTHVLKGLKAIDTGTTGWKIFYSTTGSVLINGGLFLANSIDLADFTGAGTTIAFATGSNQKACYFLQNSTALGAGHAMTAIAGIFFDSVTSRIYAHNGIAATHQYHWFDYTGTPNNTGQTFTITIAAPGVATATAHGYAIGDQVTFSTTGALPTGLVAGTVYFIVAANFTANTFSVSGTSGGAAITTTGAQSGTHTVRRAFGITGSLTYQATGNLPALTGTLLLTNNENRHTPTAGVNSGSPCVDFMTSSRVYRGKISELTNGATSWPSLETYDILSSTIAIPSALFGAFLESVQRWVYVTNTTKFVIKPDGNNVIDKVFGSLFNKILEAMGLNTVNFGMPAILGFENQNGWVLISSGTTGVRGVIAIDLRSDSLFDYSSVISKVMTVNKATLASIFTIEGLYESTGTLAFYYRTSGFGSATGGWVAVNTAEDLNISLGDQVQFKLLFDIANEDASTPAQPISLLLGLNEIDEMDDEWVGSQKHSSLSGASPAYAAFRLQYAYDAGIPAELIVDIVDDSDNVVQTFSTITDAANFSYTTTDGASWIALGTIPNTPLTTELRVLISSPPSGKVRARIRTA